MLRPFAPSVSPLSILGLALSLAAAGCGSSSISDGDQAFGERRFSDAVVHYEKAQKDKEGNAQDVAKKLADARSAAADEKRREGESHLAGSRWDQAIAAYERAVAYKPQDEGLQGQLEAARGRAAEAHYTKGASARDAGQWDDAVAAFRAATKAKPKEKLYAVELGKAFGAKGRALADAKDVPGAIAAYKDAIAADPDTHDHQDQRDMLESQMKKVAELVAEADRNVKEKNDYDAAVTQYEEVLRIWPTHPDATRKRDEALGWKNFFADFNAGVAALERRQFDEAIESFNKAAAFKRTDLLEENMNRAYRMKWVRAGDLASAERDWPKAIDCYGQGLRYAKEGTPDWKEVREKERKATREKYMFEGKRFEANRQWIEARKAYQRVMDEFPGVEDPELIERKLEVMKHLTPIRCEVCRGSGKETKYSVSADGRQVASGEKACGKCGGEGSVFQVKAGE